MGNPPPTGAQLRLGRLLKEEPYRCQQLEAAVLWPRGRIVVGFMAVSAPKDVENVGTAEDLTGGGSLDQAVGGPPPVPPRGTSPSAQLHSCLPAHTL